MSKHSATKLVRGSLLEQSVDTLKVNQLEQSEQSKTELDIEIQCGRCNEIMELHSKFDELVYFCESAVYF